MPRAVLGFSLFSLAVNMGLVRAMLTGLISTDGAQIPVVSFLAETVYRENCVIGIVVIAILWGLEVFLGSRLLFRVCEIKSNDFASSMSGAARFVLGNSTAIKVLSVIPLVAGDAFLFVIPLLVVSFAMWLGSGRNKE